MRTNPLRRRARAVPRLPVAGRAWRSPPGPRFTSPAAAPFQGRVAGEGAGNSGRGRPRSMRFALCALLLALIPAAALAAEKKPSKPKSENPPGHLLYANTVTGKGWSFFVLDGEDIKPAGIEPGFRSSWVSYPAGPRRLQFEHQPLGLVDLEADLQPGALHAFIAYADTVPQTERRRPPKPVLAVKELRCDLIIPPGQRQGNALVLLNLTPAPSLRVRVHDEIHDAPRLREKIVPTPKRGGMLEIGVLPGPGLNPPPHQPEPEATTADSAAAEEPIHRVELTFEDPGARFLVFYTDAQGAVLSLLFDDIGMYPGKPLDP